MEKDIVIDNLSLHYEVSGEGKPLVLMHGWGCDHTTVRSIAATASQFRKVYNLDLPGFGKSGEPEDVWGVEEYTRFVEKFIKQEGLENPTLVGHSFGGRISLLYSSRNKTEKVILVDAAGIKPKRPLSYYRKVYTYKATKMIYRLIFGEKKSAKKIEEMRAKKGSADYANASPRMRAILSKVVNEDLKHCMPSISAPTLLIWGENDTATPLSDAKTMVKLIPDAGLVSFPGCGHYSFLDNPGQFAAVVSSFLKN